MPRKTYTVNILNKENLTGDVISLSVAKPKDFNYVAGQFTQFYIPDASNEKKEVLRSYSIVSIPTDKDLKFCIKLVPNGKAGEYLKKIKTGEELKIGEALGRFVNMDTKNSLYFIATGVGVAPIMSIIQNELINKKTMQPLFLFFGVRSEKDIFWADKLEELKEKYKNFNYKLTLSQPSSDWSGDKGRVTEHLPQKTEKTSQFFICGNMAMITDVTRFLEEHELPKANIHFEAL